MTLSTSAVAVCCCSASVEIARARLHLVEQARVLDRDHRLVGEGLDELDLRGVNAPGSWRISVKTPSTSPLRSRGTPIIER